MNSHHATTKQKNLARANPSKAIFYLTNNAIEFCDFALLATHGRANKCYTTANLPATQIPALA